MIEATVVAYAALAIGAILTVYGLVEARWDLREHKARVELVELGLARFKDTSAPVGSGSDAGQTSRGGGQQHAAVPTAQGMATLAGSLHGLPRCVQVFFVAALFFGFAVGAAALVALV
jgi:hypothetical protein